MQEGEGTLHEANFQKYSNIITFLDYFDLLYLSIEKKQKTKWIDMLLYQESTQQQTTQLFTKETNSHDNEGTMICFD